MTTRRNHRNAPIACLLLLTTTAAACGQPGDGGSEEQTTSAATTGGGLGEPCDPLNLQCQFNRLDPTTKNRIAQVKGMVDAASVAAFPRQEGSQVVIDYYDYSLSRWFEIRVSGSGPTNVYVVRSIFDNGGITRAFFAHYANLSAPNSEWAWVDYSVAANVLGLSTSGLGTRLDVATGAAFRAVRDRVIFANSRFQAIPVLAAGECHSVCADAASEIGLIGGVGIGIACAAGLAGSLTGVGAILAGASCGLAGKLLLGGALNSRTCFDQCAECYGNYTDHCASGRGGAPMGCISAPFRCAAGGKVAIASTGQTVN